VLDAAAVTAELLETYQSATADEVLERLVETPGIVCRRSARVPETT
jgi:hypothetical protein